MRFFSLLFLLSIGFQQRVFSQESFKETRRKSYQTFAYRIPADTAEKYLMRGIGDIDYLLASEPAYAFAADSGYHSIMAIGNYLFVTVVDSVLQVNYFGQSSVLPFIVNDRVRPQLLLKRENGDLYENGQVWQNKNLLSYSQATNQFTLQGRFLDDKMLKIVVGNDTSFVTVSEEHEAYPSIWRQRKQRFNQSKAGKIINWVPHQLKKLFARNTKQNKKRARENKKRRASGKGYVLFNKPKYFPKDTIQLKAYILTAKGKQFKKPVDIWLNYMNNGTTINRKLAQLNRVTPGAFIYSFYTGDTLPNDTRYNLFFKNKKEANILNGQFRIEDYVVDEVSTYTIKSAEEKYYKGDSIRFMAAAKDANGLSLMDGRVQLVLTVRNVQNFYNERVFVADTILNKEIPIQIDGDTKFSIATDQFPNADLELDATAIFRNSNNEIQQRSISVNYLAKRPVIIITSSNGMIKASLLKDGKEFNEPGWMETDVTTEPIRINFPYEAKLDPMTENYEFYTNDSSEIDDWEDYDIERKYTVVFNRRQSKDTVAFSLYNPELVPVYYTIYNKDKLVYSAVSSKENIEWSGFIPQKKIYYLRWQYYWAGEERFGNENIALLSKLMTADIGGMSNVFPGQTDTVTVAVKDYMQKAVKNVNLTALSYNAQLANDTHVPEPPYIEKFKGKQPLLTGEYELDEPSAKTNITLGKHPQWVKKFSVDTMRYYKMLFPNSNLYMEKTRIADIFPQLSVFAVEQGVPQEIHLLYINRQLVYYNKTTSKAAYSFSNYPGYVQVGVRLKDKYVEIDSVYLQPYYKHNIVLDIGKSGNNFKVVDTVNFWTTQEKDLLNNKLLRVERNATNDNSYVWQDDKLFYLEGNQNHIVGPFKNYDSIQFYKPNNFDLKFSFEPGYQYRLSPKVARLEKKPLFDMKQKAFLPSGTSPWILGDTVGLMPVIKYEDKPTALPFLEAISYNSMINSFGKSSINIQYPRDTLFAFTVLQNNRLQNDFRIFWGKSERINNIPLGSYSVILVTGNLQYLVAGNIQVVDQGTYCIKFDKATYHSENEMIQQIRFYQDSVRNNRRVNLQKQQVVEKKFDSLYHSPAMKLSEGAATIIGKITDNKGKDGIPFATVSIKGYAKSVTAMADGTYSISKLPSGNYIFLFSALGYSSIEKELRLDDGFITHADAVLETSADAMQEVVVIGYGVSRKKSITGSISKVSSMELTNTLAGKVAGVNVTSNPGANSSIRIRGINSIKASGNVLYIVDGIPVDKLPDNLKDADLSSIEMLKDAAAVVLYGSRAANGAILISTKAGSPKMLREEFRDYAFWKPNLISDEHGEVKFSVTYPDNITSWQTTIVGMDKKHRIVKTTKNVKSFKPMLAQLATPLYLTEGDSAIAIGKKINYTQTALTVNSEFSVNEKPIVAKEELLSGNDAIIERLPLKAQLGIDTLTARFTMKASNGFSDGEQRKIPVQRKGVEEAKGEFYILNKDTTINLLADPSMETLKLFAKANTLDVFLDELDHLKEYPFYCMEQTASKITGLAMEQKIRTTLKQPFSNEKEMNSLIMKLQKAQRFDGGWGWWEGSETNIAITNYIIKALLRFRDDALIETNIRNGLLFLQNSLPRMKKAELLESLYTLNEANHDMDYSAMLKRFEFDSLTIHQQWEVVGILHKQKMEYKKDLDKLMAHKTQTMFGGLHWGERNCYWNSNCIATTILAYKILGEISGYENEQQRMAQFFLEERRGGYWRNTVESATILSAILPDMISANGDILENAALKITGDTTFTVNQFPFSISLSKDIHQLKISKTGGGLLYFTGYQQLFNKNPHAVDSNFEIHSYFSKDRSTISMLKAGQKVIMKVIVNVTKDAEYVQLEVPLPAGCFYADKKQNNYGHTSFYRNKWMLFIEKMNKGIYTYEIELEPRYSGEYHINSAKASLMYFPTFYGRNESSVVTINNETSSN